MDYEKAYKDALERAKEIHDSPNASSGRKEWLESIFPELAESEDERIRKFLIDILSSGTWRKEWPFSPVDCVAYLEKQKEQEPLDIPSGGSGARGTTPPSYKLDVKPAEWSEEDDACYKLILEELEHYKESHPDYSRHFSRLIEWFTTRFKSLRPQPHWKPSEEQMDALKNSAYGAYQSEDGPALRELYNELKKLY